MKKILILLLLPFALFAKNISIEEIEKFSLRFMQKIGYKNAEVDEIVNEDNLVYKINFKNNGFLILSADDAAFPVIGFSTESQLDFDENNTSFENFLDNYKKHLRRIKQNQLSNQTTIQYWQEDNNLRDFVTHSLKIDPLLTTRWGQEYPYNKFCPEDDESTGSYNSHVPAGCVAIAMAQIMNFWEYPNRGIGEHSYEHDDYGYQYANFDTTYNWEIMKDVVLNSDADSLQDAVANLIYHCGVAVDMGYGPEGSGAYSSWVPGVLRDNFAYSRETHMKYKDYTDGTAWINDLVGELSASRPMYYAGTGDDGGHAFVFDGYWNQEEMDFFHVNWGWSGSGNGWYVLNNLNPDDMLFNESQRSIIYIEPSIPTARFSADIMAGLQPLEIQFQDISTGETAQWLWEFGDGDTSLAQHPIHVYEEPGNYTVKLTITDTSGYVSETKIMEDYIFVKAKNELYGNIESLRIIDSDTVSVLNNVTITKTGKLVINPGVTVLFKGDYQIKNLGEFDAIGTEDSVITFTGEDWNGIVTQKSSSNDVLSILENCEISGVKNQNVLSAINQVTLKLEDVVIRKNLGPVFYNVSSLVSCNRVKIANNEINEEVPTGIRNALVNSYNGTNIFRNCLIVKNSLWEKGLFGSIAGTSDFINSTIYGNSVPSRKFVPFNPGRNVLVNFTNSIVWNYGGDEFLTEDSSKYSFVNSCIKNEKKLSDSHINIFPQIDESDYSLHPWSPCINAGVEDSTGLGLDSLDFVGSNRMIEIIDIGAIEFAGETLERNLDFTISDSSGHNPLTVDFSTDKFMINWDFDNDGSIDCYSSEVSWPFYEPGLYTPKLIAAVENDSPVVAIQYLRIFNSPPELLVESIDTLRFNEDELDSSLILKEMFHDPTDDELTYNFQSDFMSHSQFDSMIVLKPEKNYFGFDELQITAKDEYDSTVFINIPVEIIPVNDAPVWVNFPDTIPVLIYHQNNGRLKNYIEDIDNDFQDLIVTIEENENFESRIYRSIDSNIVLSLSAKVLSGDFKMYMTVSDGIDSTTVDFIAHIDPNVAIDDEILKPIDYQLSQNYPNPFNPSTKIEYSLPKDSRVNLTIYNIIGQKIITLVKEQKSVGNYSVNWLGTDKFGNIIPAGIYIYKLQTTERVLVRKMLFIK